MNQKQFTQLCRTIGVEITNTNLTSDFAIGYIAGLNKGIQYALVGEGFPHTDGTSETMKGYNDGLDFVKSTCEEAF